MVHYVMPIQNGTKAVASLGDGYTINVSWFRAYPDTYTNKIAYHIYYANHRDDVFKEGVKFVVIDGSTEMNLIDLVPGQDYFIASRPVEYDPTLFDLTTLPIAWDNVRFYPSSLLRQDMTATQLTVPLVDVEGFLSSGVVKIGVELIQFLAVDTVNDNLIVPPPGAGVGAHLQLQSNGHYYLPASTNIGTGTINGLALVSLTSPNETWNIRCIFVQPDGYALFETIGNLHGSVVDPFGNFIVWPLDTVVSNGFLSFSITQTAPFQVGDSFLVQTIGFVPGVDGGRGYNNTQARMHTISGFDGYHSWNPLVSMFTFTEVNIYDRVYACQSRFEYPNFPFTMVDGYNQVIEDFLSTDYTAADAANVTFPIYDYSGYHRTDPVQLMDGTCVGSYIGGEMGCIDGYGNFNIYRGFSLQDQNTQRQDIQLSLTGQPAVLIKRTQTGRTCACYLASSEYPDDRCPFCFAAGTLVRAEKGLIPIENINIGDKVLSADGKFHPVTQIFKNPFEGKLKSITTTTTTNPILTTEDHPFLKLSTDHCIKTGCGPNCKSYIARGDGQTSTLDTIKLSSGRWHARVKVKNHKRIVLGTFDTKDEAVAAIIEYKSIHSKPSHRLEWSSASTINKNNWLVNKWNMTIKDIEYIDIPEQFTKNTKLGSQRIGTNRFIVDEEFLWIIGIYIAEGSNSKRSIQFSLNQNENNY